jgi:hypothetical protein
MFPRLISHHIASSTLEGRATDMHGWRERGSLIWRGYSGFTVDLESAAEEEWKACAAHAAAAPLRAASIPSPLGCLLRRRVGPRVKRGEARVRRRRHTCLCNADRVDGSNGWRKVFIEKPLTVHYFVKKPNPSNCNLQASTEQIPSQSHLGLVVFSRLQATNNCSSCIPHPSAAFLLSRSPRSQTTVAAAAALSQGAEAFVGLFAGSEHPPGTLTPSLPFPSLPFPSLHAVRSCEPSLLCGATRAEPAPPLQEFARCRLSTRPEARAGARVAAARPLYSPREFPPQACLPPPACTS